MLEYGEQDHGRFKSGLGDWNDKIKSGRIQAPAPPPEEIPEPLRRDRRDVGLPAAAGRGRDALRRESRRRRLLGPLAVALHRAVARRARAARRPPRPRAAAAGSRPLPARPRVGHGRHDPHDAEPRRARSRPARRRGHQRAAPPRAAVLRLPGRRAACARSTTGARRRARAAARPAAEPARAPRGLRVPVVQPADRRRARARRCARCAAACSSPPGPRSTCSPRGSRTRR